MERLIKIGNVVKKKSSEIEKSKIGLGFEKLDRGVFNPEKVYDKVEETGVKWIRIQSGWARTEKEKGVYDNDKIKIIQGESGSQSRSDGRGAVRRGCWTPLKQAKQLLRHTVADIISGVEFTSYFSCVDMIEALNGVIGDAASYNDFGYFGVFGVEFDECIPDSFKRNTCSTDYFVLTIS